MNDISRNQRNRAARRKQKKKIRLLKRLWTGVVLAAAVFILFQLRELPTGGFSVWNRAENAGEEYTGNKKPEDAGEMDKAPEDAIKEVSYVGASQVQADADEIIVDYVTLCGTVKVEKPVKRNEREVLERLGELAQENEIISEIYENVQRYPEKLLEALANNPEMADFVQGYTEEQKNEETSLTKNEMEQEYPLFLQWDPRWGYNEYGDDSNIGLAGCGPVSLSMAIYYLTGDETLTPAKIAAYSMENDYYMFGTGTRWSLIEEFPTLYGVSVSQPEIDEWSMKNELDKGNILICAVREGDFTAGGHFIVIYGYDADGFKINDPNCVARSRKRWTFERIKNQIKNVWSLEG